MAGIGLIISTICNATFESIYDNYSTDALLVKKKIDELNMGNKFNDMHLKILQVITWVDKADNGTLIGKGVAFIIVEILQKQFNFTYDIVVPEENFVMGGKGPNSSLIDLLNSSQADMVAAFLPVMDQLKSVISYSTNLDEGEWKMMLKRPFASATGSGMMAPFDRFVWYLTLSAVFCYGPCIAFLTRLRSRLLPDERHLSLSSSFWFVYSAFIKQLTNLSLEANSTRILFATWWIFIMLMSAFYTANLTAFLTLSKFNVEIRTPEDLYKKNYRWVAPEGGAVQFIVQDPAEKLYLLNNMVASGRAQFRNFHTDFEYLPLINEGTVLVKEINAIENLVYREYLKKSRDGVAEADRCTYVLAPGSFMRVTRAFAYQHNSQLKYLFDSVLDHMIKGGIINFLRKKYQPPAKICPMDLQSKDRQLTISDLSKTFMIIVIGLSAAVTVLIGELIYKRCIQTKLKAPIPKTKSRKITPKHDVRPPPYDSLFGISKYNINENSKTSIVNGTEYYEYKTRNGDRRLIQLSYTTSLVRRQVGAVRQLAVHRAFDQCASPRPLDTWHKYRRYSLLVGKIC